MQIRKLVKSGEASFVVALPKDWVLKNKLKKGDLIYINDESSEQLVLTTKFKEKPPERKEIVINIDGKTDHMIYREISAAYIKNYFRIILKGKDLVKKVEMIKGLIYEMFALEVIDESSEHVVARDFLNMKDVSVLGLIRRIDNITRSMMIDAKNCISKEDLSEVICKRDYDVNRLFFLAKKIIKKILEDPELAKSLEIDNLCALLYWSVSMHLEKIADEFKRISVLISKLNAGKNKYDKKSLEKLFDEVIDFYNQVMKSFYNKDPALSDIQAGRRKPLTDEFDEYFEDHKGLVISEICGKFKGILSHVHDITRLVSSLL